MATYPVYADEPILGNLVLGAGKLLRESAANGLTATGSNQATALQLLNEMNRLTTVAAGTGVALPPALPGLTIFIVNRGANAAQVYGNGSDTIDGAAAATGVSQMVNSSVLYLCHIAGIWETEGLASGFVPGTGFQTITPAQIAGSVTVTQAGGTPVTAAVNHVTSSANPTAITLPASAPGMEITIALATAVNGVTVFPNAGGTGTEAINALAANAGITMGALTSATFICAVAGQWFTVPRVPS